MDDNFASDLNLIFLKKLVPSKKVHCNAPVSLALIVVLLRLNNEHSIRQMILPAIEIHRTKAYLSIPKVVRYNKSTK